LLNPNSGQQKIAIVGGVAGGASAAARARRLSEDAEIILFERGPDPSFANCGLPYYIGGEIADRAKLLVAPKEMLVQRHRLDVRTRQSVEAIDRQRKRLTIKKLSEARRTTNRTTS
jgi:NADPH-dependent 2,4-dienoyl-CoA reductase/sulfur reductase-like enzyme